MYGSPMISPTAFEANGAEWAVEHPVGTGPFKLTEFQRDVRLVFERFDDYWQEGKPYLDGVTINIIADPMTQMASFLRGDNNMIAFLNPLDAENLQGNEDIAINKASLGGGTVLMLQFDGANPESPFSDIRVRQAAAYAVDNQAIVDTVYKGYAHVDNQVALPGTWSYNPNIVGYPYNPEKARQLLEEAGYPDGFDTTIYVRQDQIFVDAFTAVQGYLAEVGIRANLEICEFGRFFDYILMTGWPTNGILQGSPGYDPDLGATIWGGFVLESGWASAPIMITPEQNAVIYENYFKYIEAPDFATKQALIWEIQRLMFDEYCIAPAILADIPLSAKYKNIHDEYTCYLSPYTWTFADAWIEK
jgi:peptide/nickel transport system substrate-binding protein